MFKTEIPFVLASASPRRQQMLSRLGLEFTVKAVAVDERVLPDEAPEAYALRVAVNKADAVGKRVPDCWVVAADTAVVVGTDILGKPGDEDAALAMLKRLVGKSHKVLTGFCISCGADKRSVRYVAETVVWFNDLPEAALGAYVRSGDPLDKAGAYGIQSFGGVLIKKIQGSYSNVVGLPLAEVTRELLRLGIIVPSL